MRILYDQNMPLVEHFFADLGLPLLPFAGRQLQSSDLQDNDILLVRSITRVNAQLCASAKPCFVGTATIGMDHLDQNYLQQQGIAYANAPGCNAQGVVDYVLACLLLLWLEQGIAFWQLPLAIVGVGNVGGQLAKRLQALGMQPLLVDPIRAQIEPGFVSLEQALAEAQIICLHTPLTSDGPFPTRAMISGPQFASMRPGSVLINAGRGEVIDGQALQQHWPAIKGHLILDVWPQEPQVADALLQLCYLATPHIAGYSFEGKARGTWMLYQSLAKRFAWPLKAMPLSPQPWSAIGLAEQLSLSDCARVLLAHYHPRRDDSVMRAALYGLDSELRASRFDQLRRQYQERHEWASLPWQGLDARMRALIGLDV